MSESPATYAVRPDIFHTPTAGELAVAAQPLGFWTKLYANGAFRKAVLLLLLATIWEIYARTLDNALLFPTFTATVNLTLQVGALEETVTVTGEAPIVDVSSAQRQQVIDSAVMNSIPANRSYEGLAALVPGIRLATNSQNVGGIQGPSPPYFTGHGGSNFEGRLRIDS